VQEASVAALNTDDKILAGIRKVYQDRRDALYEGLKGIGIEVAKSKASFYLWAKVPKQFDSSSFVAHILEKAGILTTPGNGFGAPGEGYVRFALTVPVDRMKEAVERLKKAF
jgi:LL-diaminopimelate aminotransferase